MMVKEQRMAEQSGILRDKTMADKLMYITNNDTQNNPVDYK